MKQRTLGIIGDVLGELGRMSPFKRRVVMFTLSVLVGLLAYVPTASVSATVDTSLESCSLSPYNGDGGSGNGATAMDGWTDKTCTTCGGINSQTEVWTEGFSSVYCLRGTNNTGNVCYHYSSGARSQATAINYGYGTFVGNSKHWMIENNEWYQVGGVLNRTLDAGSAPGGGGDCGEWGCDSEGNPCPEPQEGMPQPPGCSGSPILIPLTRSQAVKLTDAQAGVNFDLDADGGQERTGWTEAGSRLAFLAIDRNNNGVIDDGRELFGDRTVVGVRNGFDALQRLNMELNGGVKVALLNTTTPLFAKLLLWEDVNHNGVSEPQELQPASNVVSDIGLGYQLHSRRDGHGNTFKFRGFAYVRTAPGRNKAVEQAEQQARQISIYDVFFVR